MRADLEESDLAVVVAMLAEVIDITASIDAALWRRYLRLLLDGLDPAHASPLGVAAPSERDVTRLVPIARGPTIRRAISGTLSNRGWPCPAERVADRASTAGATQASGRPSLGSTRGQ